MDIKRLGSRIKEERERRNLSMDDLAQKAKLTNRHALASIEKGEREIRFVELLNLGEVLGIDINEFSSKRSSTSSEAKVLWRKQPEHNRADLEAMFLSKIKAYALLERAVGENSSVAETLNTFDLKPEAMGYRWAYEVAEQMRATMGLGDEPAKVLLKVLEDRFGVKVFFSDVEDSGSAACYRNGKEMAILLNSSEVPWRRNYSLAHELFHLITWTQTILTAISGVAEFADNVEKYAEAFAAGLLMPAEHLRREFNKHVRDGSISWSALIALARQFEVSISALVYRLKYINLISEQDAKGLLSNKEFLKQEKADYHQRVAPPPSSFPDRFIRLAFLACADGKISRTKVAELLELPLIDLGRFFQSFGFIEGAEHEVKIASS